MSLILAIEPDRRQGARLTALARGPLDVELVIGDTTERAFEALGPRVPDLVLTSQLLSPKDETALAERLRELDAAGAHVQTLVIPVLGSADGGNTRSGGGLFGRLRRSTSRDKASEGCDPAVFGAQITEYLDRAAAERAALAAAQADLEAAWAEEPPPLTPDVATSGPGATPTAGTPAAADDADSLFGEFASIPIPTLPDAGLRAETAAGPAVASGSGLDAELPPLPLTAAPAPSARSGAGQAEDEWEEIALDASGSTDAHNDLTAESVDLDAFVQDLHTVTTTAGAQPMIPVVDLTARTLDHDLDRVRHNEDTVSAIFEAAEPALDLADELERAVSVPMVAGTADLNESPAWQSSGSLDEALAANETFVETMTAAEVHVTPAEAAAALEAEIASVAPAPAVDAPTAPRAGWQDLLSAIRRDIGHMKTDEPAPAPRPELDLSKEPLVFPVRPALTASAIAEAMPLRPEHPALVPDGATPLASQVAHKLEASLQASLAAPLAFTQEPAAATGAGSEVSELQAAIEAQLAIAIKTSATEIVESAAHEPVVHEPVAPREPEPPYAEPPFAEHDPVIAEFESALAAGDAPRAPTPLATVEPEWVESVFETAMPAVEPPAPVVEPLVPDVEEAAAAPVQVTKAVADGAAEAQPRDSSRKEPRGTKHKRKRRNGQAQPDAPPVGRRVGDWGFFDPEQVGFGALVAKLNAVTRRGQQAALPRR